MKHGCNDCRYCKKYPGDYWTPDDYECTCDVEIADEIITRVWEDGEEWDSCDDPICPEYVEVEPY